MIGRLRGRSLPELRDRAARQALVMTERLGLLPSSRMPEARRFMRLLEPSIDAAPSSLARDIILGCRSAVPGLAVPADAAAAVATHWPADAAAIVARAEKILGGQLDLLGYEGLEFGSPPDWQLDPVLGRRAAAAHWSRIPYLNASVVGDHKVIWELSRQQYLVTLAQAWLLT